MQIDLNVLKNEEQVVLKLREKYRMHGYSCYKMSKFEEYDLYGGNKDFLVSDSVITFTDTNGRLMALKPDVTLSIVKNYKNGTPGVQRLYYNENVYRVSDKTHSYKEIMQAGLECMGEITKYNLFEVLCLAGSSLAAISEKCVLSVSHLGIIEEVLKNVADVSLREKLVKCLSEKNAHEITALCEQNEVDGDVCAMLTFMTGAYGDPEKTAKRAEDFMKRPEIKNALRLLSDVAAKVFEQTGVTVRVDLSLTNEMKYYNGIVFQGFVEGIPSAVLSGGQYDKLMQSMGKKAGAVGFAVYLDLIERLKSAVPYDADVLLICKAQDDVNKIIERVAQINAQGKSVSVQTVCPLKLVCRETEYFDNEQEGTV